MKTFALFFQILALIVVPLGVKGQSILNMLPMVQSTGNGFIICPGEELELNVWRATDSVGNGWTFINTEDIQTDYNACYPTGCTVLNEVIPQISGGPHTAPVFEARRGCNFTGSVFSSFTFKVKPTVTTTYTISWSAKSYLGADPLCNQQQTLLQEIRYQSNFEIIVVQPTVPVLNPSGEIVINKGDFLQRIKATGDFYSPTREIWWYKYDCNDNPVLDYKAWVPWSSDSSIYSISGLNFGTHKIAARKYDWGCLSPISAPVKIIVKPCQLTPATCGDNYAVMNDVENNSCVGNNSQRSDYHLYKIEKVLCSTSCNIDLIWEQYKSRVTNQAVILSDQVPASGNFGQGMAFSQLLFPQPYYDDPITDCKEIDLPRISTFALQAALTSDNPVLVGGAIVPGLVQIACSELGASFSDPILIKLDEANKCVINYTKPGHILYPGKVTRCLVQECESVKIVTFGEGTTLFPNSPCGILLSKVNDYWGEWMFKNVDTRLFNSINNLSGPPAIATQPAITTSNGMMLHKNWQVKELKIKYPEIDTIYKFYSIGDTTPFFNLDKLNVYFGDSSRYIGSDLRGNIVQGNWMYNSATQTLTTDTAAVEVVEQTDTTFTIKNIMPVYKDTSMISAECYFTFCQRDFVTNTYSFTGDGDWNYPWNWADNKMPGSVVGYGMVVYINPASADGECLYTGDLIVENGGKLILSSEKKLKVTGNLFMK